MKRIWFMVLAVSIGLNAGLLTMAVIQRPDGPPRPPGEGHFDDVLDLHLRRMTESLDLDEKQRAAIAAVHRDLLPKIAAQHRVMADLRREIGGYYARPDFTTAEFRRLAGLISEAQVKLDSLVTEAMVGEAEALTAKQRLKYSREMPWGRGGLPPDTRQKPR